MLSETLSAEDRAALMSSTKSPLSLLNRLGQSLSRKRIPKVVYTHTHKHRHAAADEQRPTEPTCMCQDKKEKAADGVGKRRRTSQDRQSEDVSSLLFRY